ncbi:MAG: cupin domain-containing protein [Chloroflexi bacterium]|nr:cupin domain-containing protein [Chloroflexota bacterium]
MTQMVTDSSGEIRVVRPEERDRSTAQTAGMAREAGVAATTVGARKLWAGYVTMAPGARSGVHHHGPVESAIYVISGRARMRFGAKLERSVDAGPGDFIYVPPEAVHQEINLDPEAPVEMIVARDGQENVVVNVELDG